MKVGRIDMRFLIIAVFLYFMVAPVHATAGFEPKWEHTAPREIVSVGPMDMYCTNFNDDLIIGTFDKVYFIDHTGTKEGSYEFDAPVQVVNPFYRAGAGNCYGLAGSSDGWAYYLQETDYDLSIPSWGGHKLFHAPDRIYSLGIVDFDGDIQGKTDRILIGTGSFTDEKYGMAYLVDNNGAQMWNVSTSDAVIAFTTIDLKGDTLRDDIVIGYGSTVEVRNRTGGLVWEFNSAKNIITVVEADLDRDSAVDDVIIGAGSVVYAVTSRKETLWEHDFGAEIASITSVDIDEDKVIEYYLVASGTVMYALENTEASGKILWSYDTGYHITEHVSVDFDVDGSEDDVAIISGNILFAYDYVGEVIAPVMDVEKSVSEEKSAVGDIINVTITVRNKGNERAHDVSIVDQIPKDLDLMDGEGLSISFTVQELEVGETSEFVYSLNATAVGNYSLPRTEVKFKGSKGHFLRGASNSLIINILEKGLVVDTGEGNDSQPQAVLEPFLSVMRSVDTENVTAGENITVDILIRNTGEGPAMAVNYEEDLPEGFEVIEGDIAWSGPLDPGSTVINTYILRAPASDEKIAKYNLTELTLIYRSQAGGTQTVSAEPIVLTVTTPGMNLVLFIIPVLIAVVAGVVFVMHKKGKIDLSKVTDLKNRFFKKKVRTPMELEAEFLAIYKGFQEKDTKPTYKDIKKKMKISTEEVDELVGKLKKKLQIE